MILFVIYISIIINNIEIVKALINENYKSFIIINTDFMRKNEIKIFKIKL